MLPLSVQFFVTFSEITVTFLFKFCINVKKIGYFETLLPELASDIAACAAANFAIGVRKGEQDT